MPADPPAKLFWSATVCDAGTRCLIDNQQQRGDRGSRDQELIHNDDGSVTVLLAMDEAHDAMRKAAGARYRAAERVEHALRPGTPKPALRAVARSTG